MAFEECTAKIIKTNNKEFFKYVRSRKLTRAAVRPLDDNRIKGVLVVDKEIAEKLNEFSSIFTVEEVRQIPVPEWMFSRGKNVETDKYGYKEGNSRTYRQITD